MAKKLLIVALVSFVILSVCSVAQAEETTENKITKWIEDHVGQAGFIYTDKSDLEEIIGATIVKDLFIEKLDLAGIYDLDKMIGLELDYIIKDTDDYDIYVGAGGGLDRIEQLDSDNWGEIIGYLGGGVKW